MAQHFFLFLLLGNFQEMTRDLSGRGLPPRAHAAIVVGTHPGPSLFPAAGVDV